MAFFQLQKAHQAQLIIGVFSQDRSLGACLLEMNEVSFPLLYKRRCAMTGESTLVVLEAAHIVPYSGVGTHDISNGILLRSDFHRLFDKGLVSITADYKIKVSPRIREAWFNGKAYYRLDDQALTVIPDAVHAKPDRDRLDWHFRNVFQG